MKFKDYLIKLNACEDARIWAADKTWNEVFKTCHRGDWLLWLYKKSNQIDLKKFTLAKAHCANTVRHLMKDERSKNAVDTAINFGNGIISIDQLRTVYISAAAAASASFSAYASASADAAAAAAAAAADAAAADAAAADAAAASAADAVARKENQLLTANICRKYLPFEIWDIKTI